MATQELFTTSIGLLSLFTIVFVLVIGGFLFRFAMRNMKEDEFKAKRQAESGGQSSAPAR